MSEEIIFEFQARAERNFRKRLEDNKRELDRAKRALRLESAKLKEQRQRGLEAIAELERIRDGFRGKGASKAAYVAILAVHRAKRALGYTAEERVSLPIYDSANKKGLCRYE